MLNHDSRGTESSIILQLSSIWLAKIIKHIACENWCPKAKLHSLTSEVNKHGSKIQALVETSARNEYCI